jgi:CheY-like chemotaxis protein
MIILYADDDSEDFDFFCMAIRKLSPTITCISAMDGEHALSILRNDKLELPQLIVLDINMSKLNGIECLRQIKQIESIKDIPVLMLSTSGAKSVVLKCREFGAHDFIVKANTIDKLANELRKVFFDLHLPGFAAG